MPPPDCNAPVHPGLDDESLCRLAVESLPSGVVLVDAAGTIVLANHQLEQQFGYFRGALAGQPVDLLLPEARRGGHAADRQAFLQAPTAREMGAGRELFGRRLDGSVFPVEVGLTPVRTGAGWFVVASVVDITARRQTEEAHHDAVGGLRDFERLIARMSVQFINLPPEGVDGAMREALERIGMALDLDRCTFFRILPDGMLVEPVAWTRETVPIIPDPIPAAQRFPWALETLQSGELVCFSSVDEIPNPIDRAGYRALGTKSAVTVPLSVGGSLLGAVGFNVFRHARRWLPDELHLLRVFATAFGNVLARRESDEALRKALAEVERLRDQLQAENVYLRAEVRDRGGAGNIVGDSRAIARVLQQAEQVAATDSTVLLLGETGTGKELFANRIHELSARRGRPMVSVNCAAIPDTLVESELFGREKGAFTGALARQVGRFELANHSTIFLDEIGDLPIQVQVKLLRVLEERAIERLGSPTSIRIDTRIIAATHRNLDQQVAEGHFREDLFYRLNVFPIQVPPLRERVEDIPVLVWRFVEQFSRTFGKPIETIPAENLEALKRYAWPGNIRELRNVVERAMIVVTGPRLIVPLPTGTPAPAARSDALADVEREHIRRTLDAVNWRVRGAGGAAERLGLKPTTLETRLARLGLKRPPR